MKRSEMIKDKRMFNSIIRNGHYNKDRFFVVYYVVNGNSSMSHFGIAIKNSIGCAVVRNRLKRQTRSIIDNNKNLFKNDKDYIIMIRNGCLDGKFSAMNESLSNLLKGIE